MAQFKYTLPSGAKFIMNAPAGTTPAQADFVFYSQVAAGSFVGYAPGETLSGGAPAATYQFELSRQDRDTAGVPNATILAISTGNIIPGPLVKPIDAADVALTPQTKPVGPMSADEVQAANAQEANIIDQDPATVDDGVGEYALQPEQLEKIGYLKPGTNNSNCGSLEHLLTTPSVWTGKNGVNSLSDVTSNPILQANMSTEIMQSNYLSLQAAGVIANNSGQRATTATTGQVYTNSGSGGGLSTTSTLALLLGASVAAGQFNGVFSRVTTALSNSTTSANTLSSLLPTPVTGIPSLASGALGAGVTTPAVDTTASATTAALVTNASQFGTPITALWAQSNRLVGTNYSPLVANPAGAVTTVTGTLVAANTAITSLGNAVSNSYTTLSTLSLGDLTDLAQSGLGKLATFAKDSVGNLVEQMNTFGRMGQFSTAFSGLSQDNLVSSTKPAAGFSDTVNRETVDAAVKRVLGNDKITTPTYTATDDTGPAADIAQAKSKLQEQIQNVADATGYTPGKLTPEQQAIYDFGQKSKG